MLGTKQSPKPYQHMVVFVKPKLCRDKGIIRLCRSDPQKRFKVKLVDNVDDYLKHEQYEYSQQQKHQKSRLSLTAGKCHAATTGTHHHDPGIMPIMYLSEWKSSTDHYKQFFAQCLCRGFPRLQIVSHKGNLGNLLNAHFMKRCPQKVLQNQLFYPRTYVLPDESDLFCAENERFCDPSLFVQHEQNKRVQFIIKPQGKSKGNGISLVTKKSDIDFNEFVVMQRYIDNPMLIDGRKFDLRLYVCIASIKPLQIYLHSQGLVRFATAEYSRHIDDKDDEDDDDGSEKENQPATAERCMNDTEILCGHLTNFTLNKKHPNFKNKHTEIKWSLQQFWDALETMENKSKPTMSDKNADELEEKDVDAMSDDDKSALKLKEKILSQVEAIIRNVFQIAGKKLNEGFANAFGSDHKHNGRCFDLLGMDVLVDTDYKCWLMEFNRYPSLKCEHDIDKRVKYDVIDDLFKMLQPRIVCNQKTNAMTHHRMPVILNTERTQWRRVL